MPVVSLYPFSKLLNFCCIRYSHCTGVSIANVSLRAALFLSNRAVYAIVSFPAPSPRTGKKDLVHFEPFLGFADSACQMTNQAWRCSAKPSNFC